MKIKSVSLQGVGVLSEQELEFAQDRINLILGENETGKSTLCNAIAAIMYRFPSKNDADAIRSWGSTGAFRGILALDLRGQEIIFERDFGNHQLYRNQPAQNPFSISG